MTGSAATLLRLVGHHPAPDLKPMDLTGENSQYLTLADVSPMTYSQVRNLPMYVRGGTAPKRQWTLICELGLREPR